jgi:hypothetical protein
MANLDQDLRKQIYGTQRRGANVGFEVEGLHKLRRALIKLDDAARDDFKAAGYSAAEIVVDEAKRLVPVRSGRLGKTIRAHKVVSGAKVSAGRVRVPYAGPIHFGWATRNIRPNPFLYDAADNRVNDVMQEYLDQVYEIWNRNV